MTTTRPSLSDLESMSNADLCSIAEWATRILDRRINGPVGEGQRTPADDAVVAAAADACVALDSRVRNRYEHTGEAL